MRPALDSAGHRVPRTKPTCLLHTWRPRRQRPFALVLHLHQQQSSRNLHLQYLAKNQSTPHCQSLITPGSDHPPVLEPYRLSISPLMSTLTTHMIGNQREKEKEKKRTKKLKQAIQSRSKGKEKDRLKEESLGPLRQGQWLDTTETKRSSNK